MASGLGKLVQVMLQKLLVEDEVTAQASSAETWALGSNDGFCAHSDTAGVKL